MTREIVEPTQTERGEKHPAFGMIGASRVFQSPPGAVLFDSDVRHQHYVMVRIRTAARRRDLHRDWLYAEEQIVEVAMSEAQWASFVSSMNAGDGVPCTITMRGHEDMPRMPYAARLQESMEEVRSAGDEAMEKVMQAFEQYKEKKTAPNLRTLEAAIRNTAPNMAFAAESLSEHAENVVQKARADIEAMVVAKAQQMGLEPGDIGSVQALPSPEQEQERYDAEPRSGDRVVDREGDTGTVMRVDPNGNVWVAGDASGTERLWRYRPGELSLLPGEES